MTETINCDVADPRVPPIKDRETEFEKPRGVNRIEVRRGFTQVHVGKLPEPVMPARLGVLKAVCEAGVNIDFLKLTPNGVSFLVTVDKTEAVEAALTNQGVSFVAHRDRAIVQVFAVNMRDEEGLLAEIVHAAIASGSRVDHIGDMHDRLLMIVGEEQAETIQKDFRERWMVA